MGRATTFNIYPMLFLVIFVIIFGSMPVVSAATHNSSLVLLAGVIVNTHILIP